MDFEMDYKKDTDLDLSNLDTEWERQSTLMREYAELLTKLNTEYGQKSRVLRVKEAKLRLQYRTGEKEVIKKDGKLLKLTENTISELVDSDEDLNKFIQNMNKLKYDIDIMKGAVEALRTKKLALEWECQLYLSSYFGDPQDQKTLLKNKNKNKNKGN